MRPNFLILLMALNPWAVFAQVPEGALDLVKVFGKPEDGQVACYRIPALITAANGDLIAAADERVPSCADLKFNADINIVIRRSRENGASWTESQTVVDYPPGESASDPSLVLDAETGEIFLFFNYMDLEREDGVFYQKVVSSKDHGLTWGEPRDITEQIAEPDWRRDTKFITSGRGIQSRSGTLLHTYVNLERGLYLFGSDDHGASWQRIGNPVLPSDEAKVAELADGTWIINGRENGAGLRHVHRSTDQGRTWTSVADSSLIDPGCNASFIRYSEEGPGRQKELLLFSNVLSTDAREHLAFRVSADQGKTWTTGRTIYGGAAAYSSMSVLENGDIGILFEKDDYREIVFTRLARQELNR